MDFAEAVEYHEQIKQYGSVLGLESIRELMHELGDVWNRQKIIHVAGTNGKGSVCCFLASILRQAGYHTGQYSSPAVFDLREVYQTDGQWITEEAYAHCMTEVREACERMVRRGLSHPTVFEVETAVAFLYFYNSGCDVVLLETGMGGSTDATNLITEPVLSVLVSVGMDHMGFLGDTLEQIAQVKAGIIKEGRPVVLAPQKPEAEAVFLKAAEAHHAPVWQTVLPECVKTQEDTDTGIRSFHDHRLGVYQICMAGAYQRENSAVAIEAAYALRELGWKISEEQMRQGLRKAVWQGRMERLLKNPLFYIDGAHNVDAAVQLRETIQEQFAKKRRIGIMGVMADKEYPEMLQILMPYFDEIHTITPDNLRALPSQKLAEAIRKEFPQIGVYPHETVAAAVQEAIAHGTPEDVILAFGSLYSLKEVKEACYDSRQHP